MSLEPTTNFKDSNGVDLGLKLVSKEYFLDNYFNIARNLAIQSELLGFGNNVLAELGTNDTTNRLTPVAVLAGGTWGQVSCGTSFVAAIKTDGTLWTWGDGSSGKLGNNSVTNRSTPITTFAGGTNWKQVSCGTDHVVAIKTDGTLWTWGSGGNGRQGINSTVDKSTPVTTFVGGTNWMQADAGGGNTIAVKTDGSLWIWGLNTFARLGINDASTNARSTPVTTFVGGTNWMQASMRGGTASAIKTDGTLWTWGDNTYAQLGVNDTNTRSTPVTTFVGGTNWKQIESGSNHISAIKTDGTLWVWGLGQAGRLGTNDEITRSTPVTTFAGGTNWKQINSGIFHTGAIKTDGTLWVLGGSSNSLGINQSGSFVSTPVTTFAGGNNWKQVSNGQQSFMGIRTVDF